MVNLLLIFVMTYWVVFPVYLQSFHQIRNGTFIITAFQSVNYHIGSLKIKIVDMVYAFLHQLKIGLLRPACGANKKAKYCCGKRSLVHLLVRSEYRLSNEFQIRFLLIRLRQIFTVKINHI